VGGRVTVRMCSKTEQRLKVGKSVLKVEKRAGYGWEVRKTE
jgi:predicted SPOUT superfamily RNA methylase MTH1